MKKRLELAISLLVIVSFFYLLNISVASAQTVESEIKQLTYYAEEYETNNINYAQLVVYAGTIKESLNEIAGVVDKHEGGILDENQVRNILGEPNEETKWVWVDEENKDKKLNSALPVWEKIIFDGNKIQIKLNAYPSLYKKNWNDEFSNKANNEDRESNKNGKKESEEKLIYRLNFNVDFKKPKEQIDITSKIDYMKNLAETAYSDQTNENKELLAQESVNIEKAFHSSISQSPLQCEETMNSIFGSENKREQQRIDMQEINFYEGDDFEVVGRLEMCDDCQWSWINLHFNVMQRGFHEQEPVNNLVERYDHYNLEDFKREIKNSLEKLKEDYARKDFNEARRENAKINNLNQAWNEKANNVWDEINKQYENQHKDTNNNNDRYYWIKIEQEKREKVKERVKNNYEERKEFYNFVFKDYEKEESSFDEQQWERRLFEVFKEFGEEICDNNIDDNKNGKTDCEEEQCGGKKAGEEKKTLGEGEEVKEETVTLYCIAGERKPKEEIIAEKPEVCGNHICEKHEYKDKSLIPLDLSIEELEKWKIENIFCPKDCLPCPVYDTIECNNRIIFKGEDKEGCKLEPVCLSDRCETDEDCGSLCGTGVCIENACEVKELIECRKQECNDGEEKIKNCNNLEYIVTEICQNGLWRKTRLECIEPTEEVIEKDKKIDEEEKVREKEEIEEQEIFVEKIYGNSCLTKEDCGNEQDVCSNGFCVVLPQTTDTTIYNNNLQDKNLDSDITDEIEDTEENNIKKVEEIQNKIIGGVMLRYMNVLFSSANNLIGKIAGFDIEEQPENENNKEDKEDVREESNTETNVKISEEEIRQRENQQRKNEDERRQREEDERREREGREKNEQCNSECGERCQEITVRCVEQCVFIEKSEETNDLEKCKAQCNEEKKEELVSCVSQCTDNCLKGERYEPIIEKREEHKEELAVFKAGGTCRTERERKEAFVFFDGWGEPFENLHLLKQKYYQGDNSEWCRWDIENLLQQRKEFEKSFNAEFAQWFFEQYLANSADKWEGHVSGIYELYWKNVDNQRQLADRMRCLGKKDITEIYNPQLLNFKYETNYGSIEYWEELKIVSIDDKEEVEIISPYMKIWVFPNIEFLKSEMKKAMEKHEFPGGPENGETNGGPSEKEKVRLKQDTKFMNRINEIAERYDNGLEGVMQLKDPENNEIIFNVLVKINKEDIFIMTPLLPEENPASSDVRLEIDFNKVYNLIETVEKEMVGGRIERPPWDRSVKVGETINNIVNGISMYFKVRGIINDAKVYPEEHEKDIKNIAKEFLRLMIPNGNNNHQPEEMNEEAENVEIAKFGDESETNEEITS